MPAPAAVKKVLTSVGAVAVWQPAVKPSASRCIVFEPGAPLNRSVPVRADALSSPVGGIAFEAAGARSRLIAVPGPQCTLGDVAQATLPLFQAADATLTAADLTLAIFAYNQDTLTPGSPRTPDAPTTAPVLPQWRVGLHLTLPIEIDAAADELVADPGLLHDYATSYADWLNLAGSVWAQPLDIPTPRELQQLAANAIPSSGAFDRDGLADQLRTRLLTNACEPVFFSYECLRRLERVRTNDLLPFVLRLLRALPRHHALLLGVVSGGHATLRRLHALLEQNRASSAVPAAELIQARRLVAEALGLAPTPGESDSWLSPQECGPSVVPLEPPLTAAAGIRNVVLPGKGYTENRIASMTLGRVVDVSNASDLQVKSGTATGSLSFLGDAAFEPRVWLEHRLGDGTPDIQIALSPPSETRLSGGDISEQRTLERMKLAVRIAGNEGRLDSTQAGDKGIVSYGMQQWAAHNDAELSVLLERFRVQAPDQYDLFLGMWGLQTERWAPNLKPADPADDAERRARKAKIDAANPFGPEPDDPAHPLSPQQRLSYFPGNVSFFVVVSGAAPAAPRSQRRTWLPAPPFGKPGPRVDFFTAGENARAWSGRIRLAALVSTEFCRVQLHQSAFRLCRIETNEFAVGYTDAAIGPSYKLTTFAVPLRLRETPEGVELPAFVEHDYHELFSSSFAAATLLDHHINKPSGVINSVKAAIARTPGPTHVVELESPLRFTLDDAWLRRFAVNYLAARDLPPANARNRDHFLITLHDRPPQAQDGELPVGLSPDPATFSGW